jgi:circadian clock protein KaiB
LSPDPLDPASLAQQGQGEPEQKGFVLRLYVTGTAPRSRRAIATVRSICDQYLQEGYDLEVVDMYQQPLRARAERIRAAPTLIRWRPLPVRRVSGDLSKVERVLAALGLSPGASERPTP